MYKSIFSSVKPETKIQTTSKSTGYQSIFATQEKAKEEPKPEPVTPFKSVTVLKTGGALNIDEEGTQNLIKTGHTDYGGIPTKKGYERADIIPVSLGGSNQSPENITYEKYPSVEMLKDQMAKISGKTYIPQTATDRYLKDEVLPAYKAGKISLNEARVKVTGFLDDQQKGLKKSVVENLPSAVAETVGGFLKGLVTPFVSAGVSVTNAARQTGALAKSVVTGKDKVPDYLSTAYDIPIYGKAEPLFTGKESPKEAVKKVVGNALEIAPYFMGVPEAKGLLKTIEVTGKKTLSQISAKEAAQFIKAYGVKVATNALALGGSFGLGTSLKEGADAKQTAANVAKSVGAVALLELTIAPLLKFGLNKKTGSIKENVDKVIKDHEDLIRKKAAEIKSPTQPTTPLETLHNIVQKEPPKIIENKPTQQKLPFDEIHKIIGKKEPVLDNNVPREASSEVQKTPGEDVIFHGTSPEALEKIKTEGFKSGNHHIYGPGASFTDSIKLKNSYGDATFEVNPKKFKLKRFETLKEERDFIESMGEDQLSQALKKEGVYDGAILPNADPNVGNHYFISNVDKLNEVVKQEAVALPKSENLAKISKESKDGQLNSRVYDRLKEEIPKEFREEVKYNEVNLKKDAEKAVELLAKDKNMAYKVAMGVESAPEGQTATAVNIAMAEKALQEGNHRLYSQLVKNRSLEQTRRGQEIVAEKGSVTDNSTARYVKELINTRLENLGKKYLSKMEKVRKISSKKKAMEVIDREVKKVKEKISDKELDLREAQSLLDKITCK